MAFSDTGVAERRCASPRLRYSGRQTPGSGGVGVREVARRSCPRGFSLLEMAVVLVIVGLLIGAVSIGRDVHRSAVNQRIASEFVQGWISAYESYRLAVGVVPGDDPAAPTGAVNASANTPLCADALRAAMLARGIAMPAGRAEGINDAYAYLDANGLPQQLTVCFVQIPWSEPGATAGNFRVLPRNVMHLTGLTPSLASTLDHHFDGRVDARFGHLREQSAAALTSVASMPWSADDRAGMGGTTALDEGQVVALSGVLRMAH